MKLTAKEKKDLLGIIATFRRQRIVVWGDMVADEFVFGEISRVSREAPVLILKHREKVVLPGGGANAVNNLADLGAQVTPVGVVGRDEAGDALIRTFSKKKIPTSSLLRLNRRVTTTKTRILAGSVHSQRQQIVRVDREPDPNLPAPIRDRLRRMAEKHLKSATALLVSDYGYGAVDAHAVNQLCKKHGKGNKKGNSERPAPITLDSRYKLLTYRGITAATPNEPEIEEAFGVKIGNRPRRLRSLGEKLLEQLHCRALLFTRGRDGMVVFESGKPPHTLSIFGSDEVADVTGAGDTVIAAFTLALAAGAEFLDAARIANCAAGLVVMKRGTATVRRKELEEAIRQA